MGVIAATPKALQMTVIGNRLADGNQRRRVLFALADELADDLNFSDKFRRARQLAVHPQDRGVDRVQRAVAHGLKDKLHVAFDRGGHNQDSAGRIAHDLPGCFGAVHDRHDQVHQDYVRDIRGAFFCRFRAVARRPGYFPAGFPGDRAPEGFQRQEHVIDDGNPHYPASPIISLTALRNVSS